MQIGYARVSTNDQNLDLQIDALKAAGCEKIIEDKISGKASARPGLDKLNEILREGDCVVVWRLDRLGRSLKHLVEYVTKLEASGMGFKSITENIDTSSASGKLVFHLFASLAEFERSLIRERVISGLEAAKKKGRRGGRPAKVNQQKITAMFELYNSKQYRVREIAEMFGISREHFYVLLKRNNLPAES